MTENRKSLADRPALSLAFVMGFFLPVPAVMGGATEKMHFRLAQSLARRGHSVTMYSRRWPDLPSSGPSDGVEHIRLPGATHSRRLPVNLMRDLFWSLRIIRALKVHDFIISNSVFFPALCKMSHRRNSRIIPWVGRMPKGQMFLYGGADGIVAPSDAVARKILEERPGFAGKLLRIPNPIDWTSLNAASMQQPERGKVTITYVGRIHPEKNLELLLDAAEILCDRKSPDWDLRIVGPVDVAQGGAGEAYASELRQRLSPRLSARFTMSPPVFDARLLAEIYGSTDIFCYPSKAERGEGLSVAPLEAMAAGAVPVLSDLACFRDYVRSGENGICIPLSGNPAEALAGALENLISNPGLRMRMSAAARQTASAFDYERVTGLILDSLCGMLPK